MNFSDHPFRRQLVGDSLAMGRLFARLERAAATAAPVFIHGEIGTGKSLCARALHHGKAAPRDPLVFLSDKTKPEDVVVEIGTGTLVIDDVCEYSDDAQAQLLQALDHLDEEGESPRLISVTRHDPVIKVAEGDLREDLYYRLFVLPIKVPPLRLRGADVIKLASHFLDRFNRLENKRFDGFDDQALYRLEDHDWPGNVRELANVVRCAVVMNDGDMISADMFDDLIEDTAMVPKLDVGDLGQVGAVPLRPEKAGGRQLWQIERDAIEAAIIAEDGSLVAAADRLGVSVDVLNQKRAWWQSAS